MVAPFIRGVGRIAASGFDFPIPPFLRRPVGGGLPSGVVEPPVPLPGVRRALPMEDPQDVNFVMPSRAVPEAPPIQVLPPQLMESLVRGRSPRLSSREVSFEPRTVASERYTDIINPIVPGRSPAQVRYMPLPAAEVSRITRYAEEDPLAAILDAVHAVEDSLDPEQFAVALQAVRAVRRGAPEADIFSPMQRTLDNAINRKAVELGIPQDVIDELPIIANAARPRGLYKESQELAQKGFNPQEQNAWPFIQALRKQKKNLAKSNPSESDLDVVGSMLFGPAGGQIMRMVRSGDIGLDHARRLHDDAVDLYLDMLRADLGTVIRGKGLRAIQGDKIAKMSDEGKTRMYAFAMQSADSPDEVAAISAIWRADITNPNFIDELDMLEGHAVERLTSYARVNPWTAQARPRATVDEASITDANVAQREFDARRATNDDTRPAFPSDDVSPEETIVRRMVRQKDGSLVEEITGGGTSRLIDTSLSTPPPSPSVPLGSGRMVGFSEEFSGPGAYVPRTIQNAQEADITIAIATDFTTGGERLTKAGADGAVTFVRGRNRRGDPAWVADPPFPYGRAGEHGRATSIEQVNHLSADIDSHAESIVNKLNVIAAQQNRPVVINGAGNGLASLRSQDEADAFARHLIDRIVNSPQRGFEIDYVVTGGQNGYDVAIAKAAKAYGIPVKINPPYTKNGSIMLQDPNNVGKVIFMEPQEYIKRYRLDTGDIGELVPQSTQVPGKGKSWGQLADGAESFEVSTKGTQQGRQYSAFNARIKGRGNKSIEDIYQIDIKGGEKLAPGRYSMKRKLPEGMTPDEAYETYKNLWREWFQENPRKLPEISELTAGKKITDQFASSDVSQARAIYEILVESGLWRGL